MKNSENFLLFAAGLFVVIVLCWGIMTMVRKSFVPPPKASQPFVDSGAAQKERAREVWDQQQQFIKDRQQRINDLQQQGGSLDSNELLREQQQRAREAQERQRQLMEDQKQRLLDMQRR